MRCKEFDPKKYVDALIRRALEKESELTALEYYLHCDTCPRDRERFEEFIRQKYNPQQPEYRLIYEGLKLVGFEVGDE